MTHVEEFADDTMIDGRETIMAGPHTLKFDDNNFESEVLKSSVPVLVDFWAEWCGPCQMLTPTVDELATEYKDRIKVGKLNIDEAPRTASQYGVQSIPTIVYFKDGRPAEKLVGLKPKREYKVFLDAKLAAG